MDAVREIYTADPEQLKSRTTMLARSLNIRLDQQCFDKPSSQQVYNYVKTAASSTPGLKPVADQLGQRFKHANTPPPPATHTP